MEISERIEREFYRKKNRGNINEKERKKKEQMTKDEKKIEREGIREKNRFLV
jgi:hypothetical protein